MAGVTDDLQKLIDEINHICSQENDLVITSGEQSISWSFINAY